MIEQRAEPQSEETWKHKHAEGRRKREERRRRRKGRHVEKGGEEEKRSSSCSSLEPNGAAVGNPGASPSNMLQHLAERTAGKKTTITAVCCSKESRGEKKKRMIRTDELRAS